MASIYPVDEIQKEEPWSSDLISYNIQQIEKLSLVAVELAVAYPKNQNRFGPIIIENHNTISGLWRIARISADCKTIYCALPGTFNGDGDLPKERQIMKWNVRQCAETYNDLSICKHSTVFNRTATIKVAPALRFKVRCTILNISNVDTVAQSFQSDVAGEYRLRAISEFESKDYVDELLKIYGINSKMFSLINGDGELEVWDGLNRTAISSAQLYDFTYKFRMKASFGEEFELHEFPFDEQNLSIVATVIQSKSLVKLEHNEEYPSTYVHSNFQLGNVFHIVYRDLVLVSTSFSNPLESASSVVYPRITFRVVFQRKPWYYVTNVALPMVVITYLSFLSFGVNSDGSQIDVASRLGITLTLLLTAVAYKFVVAGSIPQVSYLTLLDKYISVCFGCMCIIAITNALFPFLESQIGRNWYVHESVEAYAVIAVIGTFTVTNISWCAAVIHWLNSRYVYNRKKIHIAATKKIVSMLYKEEHMLVRIKLVEAVLQELGINQNEIICDDDDELFSEYCDGKSNGNTGFSKAVNKEVNNNMAEITAISGGSVATAAATQETLHAVVASKLHEQLSSPTQKVIVVSKVVALVLEALQDDTMVKTFKKRRKLL